MIALIILFVFAVYLLISALVTWGAVRIARRRGIKGWKFGVPAALGMYLLVFWDHIPTILLYKYHCATEAGFWIYKTPEQWRQENLGEEVLPSKRPSEYLGNRMIYHLNSRIDWQHQVQSLFPHITKHTESLIDTRTGERLITKTYFRSGRCSGAPNAIDFLKPWIVRCRCSSEPLHSGKQTFSQAQKLYRDIQE